MTATPEIPSANEYSAAAFGSRLRQLRESKGLSVGEVCDRLKMPARQIEALENGAYDTLPEPVFVRGFLRSYASFLDMDETVLNDYLAHFSPPEPLQKAASADLNFSNTERKKPFPTWIFGVLAALVIGYGIYAWQSKSQQENARQEAGSATLAASEAGMVSAPNLNGSNTVVVPMSASESGMGINVASAAAPSVQNGELVINTRYRTMLTVTNAQGEVLINQIVPGRSEHRFQSGAPFEVRLGYAIGSTATFNGGSIDIDAARQGGKTAVFNTTAAPAANAVQAASTPAASAPSASSP